MLPLVPLELRDEPEEEGEILLALACPVLARVSGHAHRGDRESFRRATRASTAPLAGTPARSIGRVITCVTCRLAGASRGDERSRMGEGGAEPPADQAAGRSLVPTRRARPAQGIEARGPPQAQVAGRVGGGHEDVADPDPTGAPRAREHGHAQRIRRPGRVRRLPHSPFVPARTGGPRGAFRQLTAPVLPVGQPLPAMVGETGLPTMSAGTSGRRRLRRDAAPGTVCASLPGLDQGDRSMTGRWPRAAGHANGGSSWRSASRRVDREAGHDGHGPDRARCDRKRSGAQPHTGGGAPRGCRTSRMDEQRQAAEC